MLKSASLVTAFVASLLLSAPAPRVPTAHGTQAWSVDPVHSSVIFRIHHVGAAQFFGRFNHVEGELEVDPDDPEKSSVEVRVRAESIDTNNEQRDRHVRGPDFLDARQFPWITFRSETVRKVGEGRYEVEGIFSLKGKEKRITIPVEYTGTGEFQGKTRSGYLARFSIQRGDFGVDYGLEKKLLGNEVGLIVSLETILEE